MATETKNAKMTEKASNWELVITGTENLVPKETSVSLDLRSTNYANAPFIVKTASSQTITTTKCTSAGNPPTFATSKTATFSFATNTWYKYIISKSKASADNTKNDATISLTLYSSTDSGKTWTTTKTLSDTNYASDGRDANITIYQLEPSEGGNQTTIQSAGSYFDKDIKVILDLPQATVSHGSGYEDTDSSAKGTFDISFNDTTRKVVAGFTLSDTAGAGAITSGYTDGATFETPISINRTAEINIDAAAVGVSSTNCTTTISESITPTVTLSDTLDPDKGYKINVSGSKTVTNASGSHTGGVITATVNTPGYISSNSQVTIGSHTDTIDGTITVGDPNVYVKAGTVTVGSHTGSTFYNTVATTDYSSEIDTTSDANNAIVSVTFSAKTNEDTVKVASTAGYIPATTIAGTPIATNTVTDTVKAHTGTYSIPKPAANTIKYGTTILGVQGTLLQGTDVTDITSEHIETGFEGWDSEGNRFVGAMPAAKMTINHGDCTVGIAPKLSLGSLVSGKGYKVIFDKLSDTHTCAAPTVTVTSAGHMSAAEAAATGNITTSTHTCTAEITDPDYYVPQGKAKVSLAATTSVEKTGGTITAYNTAAEAGSSYVTLITKGTIDKVEGTKATTAAAGYTAGYMTNADITIDNGTNTEGTKTFYIKKYNGDIA